MKKNFLLVHGAWHKGEAWEGVKKILEEKGHTVYTPTSPGNAENDDTLVTVNDYIRWIQSEVNKISGKVVVVGHSSAGLIMTEGLPAVKDKVELVIYCNAFVPPHGKSQFDCIEPEIVSAFTSIANSRADKCVPASEEFLKSKLAQLTSEEDFKAIVSGLVAQPINIFRICVNTERFIESGINAKMIHLTDDISVPQDAYKTMFLSLGENEVLEMPGDHEAVVTKPQEFVDAIMELLD